MMLGQWAAHLVIKMDSRLPNSQHVAVLGYLLLLMLTLLLPYHAQRKQRQRREMGLCLHCGYDLRASKERCPECGTPIPAQTVSKGGKAEPAGDGTV
jgi:hypothetical protein